MGDLPPVGREILKEPSACSEAELAAFERLVRIGFAGSDEDLPNRIRRAQCLAFHLAPESGPVAIAGMKRPTSEHAADLFARADCDVAPEGWGLDLGWVFVSPSHREAGIGRSLCGRLLEGVEKDPVFATTRPDNAPMIRILESFGFQRAGRPFPRRGQELLLFLRPGMSAPGPGADG